MDVVLEAGEDQYEMIPFFSMASRLRQRLGYIEKSFTSIRAKDTFRKCFKFSERATLAAGWWFYYVSLTRNFIQRVFQLLLPYNIQHKNKKTATLKIVDTFQDQIKKNDSDARIKMYGDVPIAAGWWSWLLK
jgi:hypothetical protein